jgi:hypothetical protein
MNTIYILAPIEALVNQFLKLYIAYFLTQKKSHHPVGFQLNLLRHYKYRLLISHNHFHI